jgi:hypothetical protein
VSVKRLRGAGTERRRARPAPLADHECHPCPQVDVVDGERGHLARRIPVSASSMMMARSRRETKSLPAHPASRACIWSAVSITVRGSGTFGGRTLTIGKTSSSPSRTHQAKNWRHPE